MITGPAENVTKKFKSSQRSSERAVGSTSSTTGCLVIADTTFDEAECVNTPCKFELVQDMSLKQLEKAVVDGKIDMEEPRVLVYVGSYQSNHLTRSDTIYQIRGVINAIRAKNPKTMLYWSCLVPRAERMDEALPGIMQFNSAVKRAVFKARNVWANVKFVDFYTEFLSTGKVAQGYFQTCKSCRDSDVAWKRSEAKNDPLGLRLSREGCQFFFKKFAEYLDQ